LDVGGERRENRTDHGFSHRLAVNLPMKQEAMETEMADSPQKKSMKSQADDNIEEEYEYKTVRYKDFVTKPKYIRASFASFPSSALY
jgi:hypothetical protein